MLIYNFRVNYMKYELQTETLLNIMHNVTGIS